MRLPRCICHRAAADGRHGRPDRFLQACLTNHSTHSSYKLWEVYRYIGRPIYYSEEHEMFKDFETTKAHLTELAEIINKFKSEAVQLRLVELIFAGSGFAPGTAAPKQEVVSPVTTTKLKRKSRTKASPKVDDGASTKKRASSGGGAVATLMNIFEEGYFKQPRSISEICAHCEVNLARRIKPNEISGKLVRMVRDRQLSRTKNSDNQYVYTNA